MPKLSTHNNILFTYDIVNKFNNIKGKKAWVALKLDIKKAYDKVEWNFLFTALQNLSFHNTWIQWIKQCISMVSYSVIINNDVHGSLSQL